MKKIFILIKSFFISLLLLNSQASWVQAKELDNKNFNFDNYSLDDFDPLIQSGSIFAKSFQTPGGIINRFIFFAFPFAGLILFLMIIWGGFEILAKATTKKSIEDGKKRITNALIGFILLFTSYWIFQIIEVIFGIQIL